jgi:hypothetical protein
MSKTVIEIEKTSMEEHEKKSITNAVEEIAKAQEQEKQSKNIIEVNKKYLLDTLNEDASYTTSSGKFTIAFREEATKKVVDVDRLINELPLIAGVEVLNKLVETGIISEKTTPSSRYITKVSVS